MSKQLSWEEHIENLKRELGVNPRIVYAGEPDAIEACRPYGGFSMSLNGAYFVEAKGELNCPKEKGKSEYASS